MKYLQDTKYYMVYSQLKNITEGFSPEACLILGSGLGMFADEIENKIIK